MTSSQIRQSFLDFFKSKEHTLVPSSSLMPDSPNLLFTNAGMNQFVPIFLGRKKADVNKWGGAIPGKDTRAADTQKCIRAGGKHNDLEDVGLDTYHHTFFEMLGNWSFGDYFKKDAIDWAWELVVQKWGFPADRLYATVFCPYLGQPGWENRWRRELEQVVVLATTASFFIPPNPDASPFEIADQEAAMFWVKKFTAAGRDPFIHIIPGNKKDNFWMMGDTGPCGPCSELHVDLTPAGDTKGSLVNQGDPRCIEIWNLVFIQFNAEPDGTFSALPAKHVDTGMGFERVTSIIQGTKGFKDFANARISNYETDIFRPIFDVLEELSGKKYGSTLPSSMGSTGDSPVPLGDPPSGRGVSSTSRPDAALHLDTPSPDAGLTVQGQGAVPDSAQSAPGTSFSKRNLPHFEKPWAIYHVILNTMAPRKLSPAGRDIVFDCLLHWRESRYRLVAACVMPDHTHLIIQPGVKEEDKDGNPVFWPLSEILHSIKSYSAKEVNKLDNVKGSLWQEERYDRYMRSDADLREKFQYVCGNPWAAGLVRDNEPWPWLWTPEIEAWKPYVPLAARKGGIGDGKGSTGDSPVRVGDPPPRMGEVHDSESNAGLQASAPSHSAGLVAQRHGQVARATQEQIQSDIAFRVIADHIRTLSFAIADGIQPGNNDRNYVLRRILRRAVRYGRTLGFHEPFFYKLVDVLADTMGDVFPEIRSKKKHVQDVIRTEEEAFNRTLDTGTVRLDGRCAELVATSLQQTGGDAWKLELEILSELNDGGWDAVEAYARKKKLAWTAKDVLPVSAEAAFELYDTYGFPLDLTELMARERGLTVDVEGFSKLMEEQRARARAAQKKEVISVSQIETTTPTKFVGFDMLETSAKVVEVVSVKDKTAVILDTSACYAEMGGQVGDTGELTGSGQLWRITNTQKSGNTWLHFIQEGVEQATSLSRPATGRTERKGTSVSDSGAGLQASVAPIPVGGSPTGTGESPVLPVPGSSVTLSVDAPRRNAIQRHHTVTHLLHWALHEVVSKDASQKGSFVGPEKLTFDFNSAPLTPQQVADIEKLVNERIVENAGVSWTEVSYADVKSRKDVMQFFGDKYGDVVRVVQISGRAGELNGYSMELCGGTHTRATGEIGLFRIVGESAIAAGMRRIEAIAGLQAYRKANDELQLIRTLAGKVNSPVHELENKIEALLTHQKELEKEVKIAMQRNASNAASELLERIQTVNGIPLITHNLGDANGEFLQAIADALKGRFKGIVVLGGAANDAVAMVATVSPDFTAKIQAGKIIQQIAPIVGGKGGGKPDNARGGGKDASKLDEALVKVKTLLG